MSTDGQNNDQPLPDPSQASPPRRTRFSRIPHHSSIIRPSRNVSNSAGPAENTNNDASMSRSPVLRPPYPPSNSQNSTLRATAPPSQMSDRSFRPRPTPPPQYPGYAEAASSMNLLYAPNNVTFPGYTASEMEAFRNMIVKYHARHSIPNHVSANNTRETWNGKAPTFLPPICKIFENDLGYEPALDAFYKTLPSPKAKAKDVEAWLKTWFEVTDLFENDFGVGAFLQGWGMTGEELRRLMNMGLAGWFASNNLRGRNRQEYPEEVIHRFYTDVQRARIYDACVRGVPGVLERTMSKTKSESFAINPNATRNNAPSSFSPGRRSQSSPPRKMKNSPKMEERSKDTSASKTTDKRKGPDPDVAEDINRRISDLSILDNQEDDQEDNNMYANAGYNSMSNGRHLIGGPRQTEMASSPYLTSKGMRNSPLDSTEFSALSAAYTSKTPARILADPETPTKNARDRKSKSKSKEKRREES